MRISMYLWSVNRGKTAKTKAYTYYWDHAMPGPDADEYGAFHTGEVPYVMNTLYMSDRPFTDADHKIADDVSPIFANFIRTGDPNGKGLAHWPSTAEEPGTTMEIGDKYAANPRGRQQGEAGFLHGISDETPPCRYATAPTIMPRAGIRVTDCGYCHRLAMLPSLPYATMLFPAPLCHSSTKISC